jgi:hypothetical protein
MLWFVYGYQIVMLKLYDGLDGDTTVVLQPEGVAAAAAQSNTTASVRFPPKQGIPPFDPEHVEPVPDAGIK